MYYVYCICISYLTKYREITATFNIRKNVETLLTPPPLFISILISLPNNK